ncbi:MAG: hypothetical protein M0Z30_18760 [Actinomycetota bacterium]|nr:hypothetical protein [Actinomycetota bacterium]
MGAQVQLANVALSVEPGRSSTTVLTVRNNGDVVDRYTFEALGPAAPWVSFAPDSLSLFPAASATVEVTIAPPRTPAAAAGSVPFGVRAVSTEDPSGSSAEEGTVEVARFSDVSLEMLPRVLQGRRLGLARVAIDNRSNFAYEAELGATDPAAALQFAFRPPVVSVAPGAAEFVRMRVRPVKPFWRGHATTRPFLLSLASQDQPHKARLDADGAFLQQPILPKWLATAIAALVALVALAVVLWFALVKPQVRSTAKDAANQSLAAAGLPTNQPSPAGGGGGSRSGGGGSGAGSGSSPTTASVAAVAAASGGSVGLTVNGSSVASGNGTRTIYVVPFGRTLQVTDMLIQNAAGDNGTLTLARSGTVLMQWSMADFRDLDYHWVSPTVFSPGDKMVMTVSGCSNACHPGVYYAGTLVTAR